MVKVGVNGDRGRGVWDLLETEYVYGVTDDKTGRVEWPTCSSLANKHDISYGTINNHMVRERWTDKRRKFKEEYSARRRQDYVARLAEEVLDVEGKTLDMTKQAMMLVGRILNAEEQKALPDDEVLKSALTSLEKAHKVTRLIMDMPTQHIQTTSKTISDIDNEARLLLQKLDVDMKLIEGECVDVSEASNEEI